MAALMDGAERAWADPVRNLLTAPSVPARHRPARRSTRSVPLLTKNISVLQSEGVGRALGMAALMDGAERAWADPVRNFLTAPSVPARHRPARRSTRSVAPLTRNISVLQSRDQLSSQTATSLLDLSVSSGFARRHGGGHGSPLPRHSRRRARRAAHLGQARWPRKAQRAPVRPCPQAPLAQTPPNAAPARSWTCSLICSGVWPATCTPAR